MEIKELAAAVTQQHIEKAANQLDQEPARDFGKSTLYDVVVEGNNLPPKAVFAQAVYLATGTTLGPYDFHAGLNTTCFKTLENAGFKILAKELDQIPFERGVVYNRQRDIHRRFGGSKQSGISPSSKFPLVFLFTGGSGEQHGYIDEWEDGVFLYSGEGQLGDQEFARGNKAIRDHAKNGKELLLFKIVKNGVRFEGIFHYVGWRAITGQDRDGNTRRVIQFELIPESSQEELADITPPLSDGLDIEELRKRAYQASTTQTSATQRTSKKTVYQRSGEIRAYVLKRANGKCESCEQDAPFTRIDGQPYLECHHTTRVSDGGLDDPAHVAAICPTCHREIHHGESGSDRNTALKEKTFKLERRKDTS